MTEPKKIVVALGHNGEMLIIARAKAFVGHVRQVTTDKYVIEVDRSSVDVHEGLIGGIPADI